ncbi:15915_t:CDS:1 [Gigaspora margarita]|uniref:15915_t:CDS:1 n=1 Tax=Gigaspora margarita TaxID=4874 RepID=A0ABM8VZS0_GIGMA|nr:15915_t:CDS:1 [Gigaspora margarita]
MHLLEYLKTHLIPKDEKDRGKFIVISHVESMQKRYGDFVKLFGRDESWIEQLKLIERGELDLTKYLDLEVILIQACFLKSRLTKLNVASCSRLVDLSLPGNQLTDLDLANCCNLKELNISKNQFTSLDFLKLLPNPEKLEILNVSDNCIQPTTLDFVRPFLNLKNLSVGNDDRCFHDTHWHRLDGYYKSETYINVFGSPPLRYFGSQYYNHIYDSLEPLKNLSQLKLLNIDNTDIDSGLEYLPDSIEKFWCSGPYNDGEKNIYTKVKTIRGELEKYGEWTSKDCKGYAALLKLWKIDNLKAK